MANVLIVDDETNIREGIGIVLQEADLGIGQVFLARNGHEALDYLRLEHVDLVLTDIRMERMDGLELLGNIYIEQPNLPVIMISAYDDFAYAQEALRLGAKDYLVKPLDGGQLIRSVRKWLHIEPDAIQLLVSETLSNPNTPPEAAAYQHYVLNDMLESRNLSDDDVQAIFDSLKLTVRGPYYGVIRIRLNLDEQAGRSEPITTYRDRQLFKYATANIISETLGQWAHLLVLQPGEELTVILQTDHAPDEASSKAYGIKLGILAHLIHKHIVTYLRIPCAIGMSGIRHGLSQLHLLKNEACRALAWHDRMPDQAVFYIHDFDQYPVSSDPGVLEQESIGEINSGILQKVQDYLHRSYNQKGLQIQDIADEVHLSANHVSYLFRKFMKMSVWDYVLKLRMERARYLLLSTDMKRYEISEAIGYETPEHFSKIFKKYYGVTPSDMRN